VTGRNQEIPGRWSRRKRDIGTVVWISFLAACVGTFVIFAVMDVDALSDAWVIPLEIGSRLAYSLGFIFLFVVSLIASGLTVFMIRTGPERGHAKGKGPRPPTEIQSPEENNPDLDLGDWK
jgi:hypothetical protein